MIRPLLTFIALGLLLALPGEILNQVLSKHNPAALGPTFISYFILLLIGFFVGRGIDRAVKNRSRAAILYYLLFGTFGLMIEWFLLGNAPVPDPFQIVTQPGMFTFWGTMLLAPRLLMEPPEYAGLKRRFVRFFVGFSLLYILVALVIPRDHGGYYFGFILFAAGTAALNYFYVRYFRMLSSMSQVILS